MQQNPANADESASAYGEMNAQAGQMRRMVDDLVSLVSGAVNDRGIKLIEKETPTVLLGGLGKKPHYVNF
ncbi:MAG: hypothetical protein ACYSR3_15125 [Planctomycetota bacterium]